jgi:tight adherence protein B
MPGIKCLDRLVLQAGSKSSAGLLIFLTLGLLLIGYFGLYLGTRDYPISILGGVMLGTVPVFYLIIKKKQRMDKFEKQLPEALELMSRSLKAGRALQSSMKLAAEHFSEPLGPEFEETLDEINFGLSVPNAFKNLTERIACPDLRFFVVATILQRETGGNLAEITESLAYIIRERFKLKGKIRILSAEGKLSAIILTALPFTFLGLISIFNPEHLEPLFNTDAGRMTCSVTIALMATGIFVVKKMTNFKI